MALRGEPKALEEANIDADFAEMAGDEGCQAEADVLEKEFARGSWEAFESAEAEAWKECKFSIQASQTL